jgi:hypothetical protein
LGSVICSLSSRSATLQLYCNYTTYNIHLPVSVDNPWLSVIDLQNIILSLSGNKYKYFFFKLKFYPNAIWMLRLLAVPVPVWSTLKSKIGICCLTANWARSIKEKEKTGRIWNQDNLSKWSDMSTHGLLFSFSELALKNQLRFSVI